MNLAEQLEPEDLEVNISYPLSQYFEGIITALLNASQQEQANTEINFRASIYEAMSTLVSHCSKDCLPVVAKLTEVTLQKLDETIMLQVIIHSFFFFFFFFSFCFIYFIIYI